MRLEARLAGCRQGAAAFAATLAATLAIATLPVATAAADSSCSQSTYSIFGKWASQTYPYAIKGSTVVGGSEGVNRIVDGHHAWLFSRDACGFGDFSNYVPDFTTSGATIGVHSYNDGYNRVDFGSMSNVGCNESADACAFQWVNSYGHIYEADIRLNSAWLWHWGTGNPCCARDIWNVVAHEAGHSAGFADLYASSATDLTEYGYSSAGEIKKRTLGYGDVRALNRNYPK